MQIVDSHTLVDSSNRKSSVYRRKLHRDCVVGTSGKLNKKEDLTTFIFKPMRSCKCLKSRVVVSAAKKTFSQTFKPASRAKILYRTASDFPLKFAAFSVSSFIYAKLWKPQY